MEKPELLPCPFCGEAKLLETENQWHELIACLNRKCDLYGYHITRKQWNMRRAPGWMPIETAPKDGSWIVAFRPGVQYFNQYMFVHWNKAFEEWSIPGSGVAGLTHWQPLPAAPEE